MPRTGDAAARRAVVRWAWRMFRREWRQQILVMLLLTVAVAGAAGGDARVRESYEDWQARGRDLIARRLAAPMLIVADGAPGLNKAIEQCWPASDSPALLRASGPQPVRQAA